MKTILEIVNYFNDQEAFLLSEEKKDFLYSDLKKQINYTHDFFTKKNIQKEDTIAIIIKNGPDLASLFVSVSSYCKSAPLNTAYTISEFDFYVNDLNPKAIIVNEDSDSPVIEVAMKRGIEIFKLSSSKQNIPGKFILKSKQNNNDKKLTKKKYVNENDIALILHTSGTTSKPKMVPLTHLNLCTSAKNIVKTLGLKRKDRCINIMPLFHIHGIVGLLLSTLYSGGSIFASPGFNGLKFFSWLQKFSPTWYSAVPTMHQTVLSRAGINSKIICDSKLRFIRSSSAPLPGKTMEELEKIFNCPVIESYGMTETSHQMTSNFLPPGKRRASKAGFAAGPEVKIIDNNNNFLKSGKIGEIVIKGKSVTKGYINNSKENKKSFTRGWFRTGDQGFYDKEGFLQITGRIKEIINKGGEKISPLEIDEAIMENTNVFQAITFSINHEKLGEDIGAAIVLKKNHNLTSEQIKNFLKKKLAHYKIPKKIVFLDEIPKGKTGKLQRIGLASKIGLE